MKNKIREILGKFVIKFLGLRNSLKLFYFIKTGNKLNLENPSRFREKIQLRKLNYNNPLYSLCADKYNVRKYVKDKIGEKYLIPLLYVGTNIDRNIIKKLPKSFIIKTNNASKTNIIVIDKDKENIDKIVSMTNKNVKKQFWYRTLEMFYSKIEPKIIVEELIRTKENKIPDDYKFHIFNNKSNTKIIIEVDFDRQINHKRLLFTENWEKLDYLLGFKENDNIIDKPKNLKEMLIIAKKLSEEFDYVRVDLYSIDGKIYFGELTFTHGSGYEKFIPDKIDFEWGKYWN